MMNNDDIEAIENLKGKKIIATTDKSLKLKKHQNGCMFDRCLTHTCNNMCYLPQPSKAFIKKYCDLGGIDEIMVDYGVYNRFANNGRGVRHVTKLKINSHNEITIHPIKDSWTREEVIANLEVVMSLGINYQIGEY